jgi:hypothetical protein
MVSPGAVGEARPLPVIVVSVGCSDQVSLPDTRERDLVHRPQPVVVLLFRAVVERAQRLWISRCGPPAMLIPACIRLKT